MIWDWKHLTLELFCSSKATWHHLILAFISERKMSTVQLDWIPLIATTQSSESVATPLWRPLNYFNWIFHTILTSGVCHSLCLDCHSLGFVMSSCTSLLADYIRRKSRRLAGCPSKTAQFPNWSTAPPMNLD